jgi:hypothetical protein
MKCVFVAVFKATWSKHTNFTMQDIEISQISGQMAYGKLQ